MSVFKVSDRCLYCPEFGNSDIRRYDDNGIPVCCSSSGNGDNAVGNQNVKACCFEEGYRWDSSNNECYQCNFDGTENGSVTERCCLANFGTWDGSTCTNYSCATNFGMGLASAGGLNERCCYGGYRWCYEDNECMSIRDYCSGHCSHVLQYDEFWCDCVENYCKKDSRSSEKCYAEASRDDKAPSCAWYNSGNVCPSGQAYCEGLGCVSVWDMCSKGVCQGGAVLASMDVPCTCTRKYCGGDASCYPSRNNVDNHISYCYEHYWDGQEFHI